MRIYRILTPFFWKSPAGQGAFQGWKSAHVAQLVERILGKDEVTGPTPVVGSILGRIF